MENYEKTILEIFNSDNFDRETYRKLVGESSYYETERNIECISGTLQTQYMDINVENILANHSREEITDFLNRLTYAMYVSKTNSHKKITINEDELEEFKVLASETDKISKAELSQTAPVLTKRAYLDMCRVAYDAIYGDKYPPDVSTAYIFCDARMLSFEHEYKRGILGADWDSPEQFAEKFSCSYHDEELEFGGLTLVIHDESALISEGLYTSPTAYKAWTGYIHCDPWDTELMCKSIKAYIALRRKQYPIYFSHFNEAYSAMQKSIK